MRTAHPHADARPARSGPTRLEADGIPCAAVDDAMDPTSEHLDRAAPVVTTPTPGLSWVVPLERNDQRQTGYQIRVASADRDPRLHGDLWDSGEVTSTESRYVPWAGPPLAAHDSVRWSVRTRDERQRWSAWSVPHRIEAGPFSLREWGARWIEIPATHRASIRFSRRSAKIARARLHLTAQGYVRASIGSTTVNGDCLDPTDASLTRAAYRSYDVSDLLGAADAELAVTAGLGHFRRVLERPRVLAALVIDYADGLRQVVGTDGSWVSSPSQVIADEPYYLEAHDTFRAPEADPLPVAVVDPSAIPAPPSRVEPNVGPPVRTTRMVTAVEVGRPAPTVRVFDLGENIAGRVVLDVDGASAGSWIESVQGEKLSPAGFVDTSNIRLPADRDRERQVFRWRCSGDAQTAEPWFGVQGFRYVEVRGIDTTARLRVRARVIHSEVPRTGTLHTSHPLLDRLVDIAVRTQLNNTHGYPEDCPTREQAGWTGDAAVAAEAALCHLDMGGVYRHWLDDVILDMSTSGGVPGVAPILGDEHDRQPSDPVWGAALTEIPWRMWRESGETAPLRRFLEGMRRWVDWQLGTVTAGIVTTADLSFGADWLALEQTPPALLQTAAVITSLRRLADLESAMGDEPAAERRRQQSAELTIAARARLFDTETGLWANNSQASLATAIVSGLAAEGAIPAARASLLDAVDLRGGRLASGFAGTSAVVRALADVDGGQRLLDAVELPDQPGLGAMLVDGPGTFWETWWIDDENVGVASLDHIGLAAPFAAWVWRDVVGLRALEPGYRVFAVEPRLTDRVSSASFTRRTVRGDIECSWALEGSEFSCTVTVPVGSIAEITVPGRPSRLSIDGEASDLPLVDPTRIRLGSGHHRVTAHGVAAHVEPRETRPAALTPIETTTLLSDGVKSSWTSSAARVRTVAETVVCRPVFHEPIPGPTLLVEHDHLEPDIDHLVTMVTDPIDMSGARTVFAHLDLDNPAIIGRAFRIILTVRGSDGTFRRAEARPMPIQWNRVAVDVEGWSALSSVVDVAVGIRWSDTPDLAMGPATPLPARPWPFRYRIGRVGWTNASTTY